MEFPAARNDTPVMIREFGGDLVPFDPDELQARLISCFLASGLRESVDLPQDIVLAGEYTLRKAPREELIFGRGELERAVIRLLEEAGFPETARLYRSGCGTENELYVTPERETLSAMLRGHLGCSREIFEQVMTALTDAAAKLEIEKAPAHLFLELARYYEHELTWESTRCDVARTPEITLSREEIAALLPPEARALADEGVLRVDGVTTLFPCVHLFFRLERFVRSRQLTLPVTELELEPLLYEVSAALAAVQKAVEERAGRALPVILAVPDMSLFIGGCAGADREHAGRLASELGEVLCSAFPRGVYKLNMR